MILETLFKAAGIEAVQTEGVREWTAIDAEAEKDGKAIIRNRALNPKGPMGRFQTKIHRQMVRGKVGAESRKGLLRD
jgi:hypothetical protein